MGKKRVFGELELAVMQIIRNKEKITVKEVVNTLGGTDKYTTIMTVMSRLVEKKLLVRERKGGQYEYWINQFDQTVKPNFLEKLKQKVFGGKSVSMVSYLLESSDDITDKELEALQKMIENLKKSRKLL
jgi:predicted transcriptional regulator